MTDQALRRTDELLSELVELVETARSLPMSSSCVLPREHVLDLLDELRETMPPEMDEARRVLTSRDTLLHDAYAEATQARELAGAEAEALVAQATERADEVVAAARARHEELVSATAVHSAAEEAALRLHADAERAAAETRAQAGAAARDTAIEAERYAAKLVADAERYADSTLADLADTLTRAAQTAEQGRSTLAQRRARSEARAPFAAADAQTEAIADGLSAELSA